MLSYDDIEGPKDALLTILNSTQFGLDCLTCLSYLEDTDPDKAVEAARHIKDNPRFVHDPRVSNAADKILDALPPEKIPDHAMLPPMIAAGSLIHLLFQMGEETKTYLQKLVEQGHIVVDDDTKRTLYCCRKGQLIHFEFRLGGGFNRPQFNELVMAYVESGRMKIKNKNLF